MNSDNAAAIGFWIIVGLGLLAWFLIDRYLDGPAKRAERRRLTAERTAAQQAQIVCVHCHQMGWVRAWRVVQKKGVSGGKATAGILTGGASLVFVGLSRKEAGMRMHCENCGMSWMA